MSLTRYRLLTHCLSHSCQGLRHSHLAGIREFGVATLTAGGLLVNDNRAVDAGLLGLQRHDASPL